MTYPKKPSGDYILRDYDFGTNDKNKLPMDEYMFKNGYRNADESELESVPDAHNENWFYDLIHQNLRYTQQVAEENKKQLENKVATPTSIGQVKIGYGLEITPNGVLSVTKDVAQDANIISYDLPVGSYMLWAGSSTPEYFIEPKGQTLLRASYPDLWEFAQSNNLVANNNNYVSGKLFGIGDGKTTFKVFDIRGKFLKIANDKIPVGTYEEAGLPNIKTPDSEPSSSSSMLSWQGGGTTVEFGPLLFEQYANGAYSGSGQRATRLRFDASKANPIYGNSDTVTPENYALKLILKALPTPPSNAVPTGTILDYTANSAPDGYIIANGAELSRTTFNRLYNWALANNLIINQSEIPSTAHGFYGTGNGSTTFTIPDLRGVFKRSVDLGSNRGGTSLGTYQEDGLPNIEGTFSTFYLWSQGNASGAFKLTQTNSGGAGGSGAPWYTYTASMDASRSNSIYGASDYVQPKSVSIIPILKY